MAEDIAREALEPDDYNIDEILKAVVMQLTVFVCGETPG